MSAADIAPAAIPFKVAAEPSSGELLLVLLGVLAVIGLVVALLLWLRRSGRFGLAAVAAPGRPVMHVVGGKRLSMHSQAWLLEVDGQRLLVVESSRSIATRPIVSEPDNAH